MKDDIFIKKINGKNGEQMLWNKLIQLSKDIEVAHKEGDNRVYASAQLEITYILRSIAEAISFGARRSGADSTRCTASHDNTAPNYMALAI